MDMPRRKYARSVKTISGRLHDELVMMDIEQGRYFSLNPVATRIWELLEQPMEAEELCVILMDEYDVEPQNCREDVSQVLKEMLGLGLLLTHP